MIETELWVEKYRPETLDEIVNHDDIIETLQSYVENGNVPNLIFAGPAGVGKTASALAIAHDLYGEQYEQYTLELNASDKRGIDMVRNELKEFSRSIPSGTASYKLLILDEADHLTSEAQHALRRTMEKFSDLTRYVLICNYSSKIIEPIQSRCSLFTFSHLPEETVQAQLAYIANQEQLTITDEGIQALVDVSRGDLRKAINLLQSVAYRKRDITKKVIYDAAGKIYPKTARNLVETAFAGEFETARTTLTELLVEQGIDGSDLLRALERAINQNTVNLDPPDKIQLNRFLSELDFRISEGATDYIQLTALLAELYELGRQYKK